MFVVSNIIKNELIHYPEFKYVDSAFGDVKHRNRVQILQNIKIPQNVDDCYTSMFRFKLEYFDLCKDSGSVSGASRFECFVDYLWFDIDAPDPKEALLVARRLLLQIEQLDSNVLNSIEVFFSGMKGFHFGIPSQKMSLEPSRDLPRIMKAMCERIAEDLPVDRHIYDCNRLLRIPNTKHSKSQLFKTRLTIGELLNLEAGEITAMANHQRDLPSVSYHTNLSHTPSNVLSEMARECQLDFKKHDASKSANRHVGGRDRIASRLISLQPGNRNSTFASLAGRLHHDGWSELDIIMLLEPWAARFKFSMDELRMEIGGICSRYPGNTASPSHHISIVERGNKPPMPEPLWLSEFLAAGEDETPWLVDRLIPVGGITIIAGPPGYGKSWFLHDLALACATGTLWLNHFKVIGGPVLYVDEESPPVSLRHRFKRLLKAKKLCSNDIDLRLLIRTGVRLTDDTSMRHLTRLILKLRPTLLILDSFIRLHDSNENSATEMSNVSAIILELVNKTGCTIVLADHQRKSGLPGERLNDKLRGSTEKLAFIDSLLSLHYSEGNLSVEHSKSRNCINVSTFSIEFADLNNDGFEIRYLGDTVEIKHNRRVDEARKFVLKFLDEVTWHLRTQVVEAAKHEEVSRNAVDFALKALTNESHIDREDRPREAGRGGKIAHYRLASREGADFE